MGEILEHYSAEPLVEIFSRAQDPDHQWRGKPKGIWVSAKGEDDWPSWCEGEHFALERLAICHRIILSPDANILRVSSYFELSDFDQEYGRDESTYAGSPYAKRFINWVPVAEKYDGILIAPYQWGHRLDGPASSWYYGWDCASGVIWNAKAIESFAPVTDRIAA